jgi:predicted AAA+ superfamily ATPase
MEPLARHITPRLQEALKISPRVFLNGPRQAGKSTLVQTLAPKLGANREPAQYVTLDRPDGRSYIVPLYRGGGHA